ncbi:MAG: tRNA (adenosine(37)-N6)-threonylcarbamoyltransferase complex transferase subunit TsaD [Gammaproteobacteria bacterium]|nr:tRNA (adenosine(37)-N6)-threonylcarbamoyltransferase complex transferase subunit TsaD [Gammaproteobacteria bacterium]
MRVLGIESSCDDTGIALFDSTKGLLAHALHSQTAIHQRYGGVVPELASRDHVRHMVPLLQSVLRQAQVDITSITAIAYTAGPGLMGSLLVGACFAKALGYALDVPTLGIHHLEGHLLAPLLENPAPDFPFVALLVSGGHTLLVDVQDLGQYQILGESLDDAAGEAFDKIAKLLGLPFPGGPALAALAEQGLAKRFVFPRPLSNKPGMDFSFSGLKTHTLQTWKASTQSEQDKADIAHAFQEAVVQSLIIKTKKALEYTGRKRLVVAGGVSANLALRQAMDALCRRMEAQVYYPRIAFCTDNGAMIAFAGYKRLQHGKPDPSLSMRIQPRWPLDKLGQE